MSSTEDKIKMAIVVRKDLNMRKGKMCAQVAHSLTLYYEYYNILHGRHNIDSSVTKNHKQWIETGYTKIVLSVNSEIELQNLIKEAEDRNVNYFPVIDFGLTEFHGVKTLTCCAFGPDRSSILDKFLSNLKLI